MDSEDSPEQHDKEAKLAFWAATFKPCMGLAALLALDTLYTVSYDSAKIGGEVELGLDRQEGSVVVVLLLSSGRGCLA